MQVLCAYGFFLVLFPELCQQNRENDTILPEILTRFEKYHPVYKDLLKSFLEVNPVAEKSLLDTAKNPFSYLEENNYHYENHTIVTEDGYILLAVRIPFGKKGPSDKKRPPVIFVHGIFCSFYDFLNAGPDKAIGFQILEEGYDLWLLNTRGNTFSKTHVTLDPVLDAPAYWNFSWHEVGIYDVPATMDHIAKVTGFSQVSMVGHSQGGTVYLALAASRPEYDRRITFSLQLAPVSYLTDSKQIIVTTIRDNLDLFDELVKAYNWYELFPHNEIITRIATNFCNPNSKILSVCSSFLQIMAGPSTQTNESLVSVLAANDPSGGSAKQIKHYIQVAISGNFQLYDYGPEGNQIEYNQTTPPLYNLSGITSPVAIYYGRNDYFISVRDGTKLASQIPNSLHFILGSDTNHIDVQWGSKAVENIHKPAIKLLNKYNRKTRFKESHKN